MWKWKSKSHRADEDASGPASSTSAPPPAYGAVTPQLSGSGPLDLSAALGAVSLGPTPPHGTDSTEDTCLAHLRLLTAFNRLEKETGYRDGLWEIWDSRAKIANAGGGNDKAAAAAAAGTLNPDVLVKLREKRWAVYVGRAVDQAISGATFDYVVSDSCVAQREARTSLAWCNEDDPDTKEIRCPSCPTMVSVPWTTCGQPRDYSGTKRHGIAGEGYADGHLTQTCPSCSVTITHESPRAAKFRNAIQASATSDHAMPGTILDLHTSLPKPLKYDSDNSNSASCPDQLFPARLARRVLLAKVLEMLKPGSKNFTGKLADSKNLREVMNRHGHTKVTDFRLSLDGRRQTRTMVSRYWESSSPFSIDLVGCVMGQGTFTGKMCKVTHQLSPKSYFVFTRAKTSAFVDHNDEVDEDKLSTAFEWTSKTYQKKYGEVYSQCKCWYCESKRFHHPPSRMPATPRSESGLSLIAFEAGIVFAGRRTPALSST
ncbi:hypothetical protein CSHISOI_05456 [Colletotrichum shisoi]|uniref:Uncharacterized protein n=1 Tax=Colletotrichum shisoi TaxID=2078593 RepID=A0A5Q4BSJ5_9PEZI|nr:hypothetical protein CSHISOI_05456 [Colletotrichum shisoi]